MHALKLSHSVVAKRGVLFVQDINLKLSSDASLHQPIGKYPKKKENKDNAHLFFVGERRVNIM